MNFSVLSFIMITLTQLCLGYNSRSMIMRSSSSHMKNNKSLLPQYKPRSLNQKHYVQSLENPNVSVLLGVGPAGTGKTLFACNAAVQELKSGKIQKIIVTRPLVSVEEELGFLPGNIIRKMDPWTRPLFDILGEFYSQKEIDAMLQSGTIEISPLAFMRGRTFKRAFVIADEMQNSSPNQMMMLTTRLGEDSKMVITGDLKQSDRMKNNGLADLLTRYKERKERNGQNDTMIHLIEFDVHDIQRSPVVNKILELYDDSLPKINVKTNVINDCALIPDDPLLDNKSRFISSISAKDNIL